MVVVDLLVLGEEVDLKAEVDMVGVGAQSVLVL